MRNWFARWLRRWADWLDPAGASVTVAPDLLLTARRVVAQTELLHHTGSYKRVQAIKALRAAHPDEPRRDVSLAIELAVRGRGPS
jgi:hypothetical protein